MPASRIPRVVLALTLVVAVLLTACGSSNNAPDAQEDRPSSETDGDGNRGTPEGIELTDANGTVTLDEPAVRVVALEWTYVEDLLAVGVTPVGVADVPGYRQWVGAEPDLAEDVEDVGTRQEPSIERIRRLDPDLVITGADRAADLRDQLGDDVPVVGFDPYAGDSQLEAMTTTFSTIATAVGKADEAEQVLADLDAQIAAGKAAIADADLATTDVALAQGEGTPDAPMFRLFTDNAMVVQLMTQLGLENGWDGPEEEYGFNSVSLEGLTAVGDAWFLPVAPEDAMEAFDEKYGDSPLWTSLDFVKADRVRPLGNEVWFFGGPLSAGYLVENIVTALGA